MTVPLSAGEDCATSLDGAGRKEVVESSLGPSKRDQLDSFLRDSGRRNAQSLICSPIATASDGTSGELSFWKFWFPIWVVQSLVIDSSAANPKPSKQ